MEENFISQNSVSEEVLARIRSINHWRTCLVVSELQLFDWLFSLYKGFGYLLVSIFGV